jgi:cytochrome b6-f complex iron-sulfur subunit
MIGWTRRRFLGATAAAVCVGCTDAGVSTVPSPTSPPSGDANPGADVAPAGSLPRLTFLVEVGTLEQVRARESPLYVPAARAWLAQVPDSVVDDVVAVSDESLHPGLRAGLLALYEKCPHLGCRVPFCESSGWFECPCHASTYTSLGEHRDGPGPRGLDAFPVVVDGGIVSIDNGVIVSGHPVGTVLVDQPADGPSCVGSSDP